MTHELTARSVNSPCNPHPHTSCLDLTWPWMCGLQLPTTLNFTNCQFIRASWAVPNLTWPGLCVPPGWRADPDPDSSLVSASTHTPFIIISFFSPYYFIYSFSIPSHTNAWRAFSAWHLLLHSTHLILSYEGDWNGKTKDRECKINIRIASAYSRTIRLIKQCNNNPIQLLAHTRGGWNGFIYHF